MDEKQGRTKHWVSVWLFLPGQFRLSQAPCVSITHPSRSQVHQGFSRF